MTAYSKKSTLVYKDWEKWLENQISFLKPLALFAGTLYFTPIIADLQIPGHVISTQDFIPSSYVITSIVLYMVNGIYDLIRKWASEKTYP